MKAPVVNIEYDFTGKEKPEFIPGPPPSNRCKFAEEFFEWTQKLWEKAEREKAVAGIKTAKLLLLEKYMEWRNSVPKAHRNRLNSTNHICLFGVFTQTYERLQALELEIGPSPLKVTMKDQAKRSSQGILWDEQE